MKTFESDVCIIGGGISAALLSQKLSELAPDISITVVEAGQKIFDFENRMSYRQRMLDYEENPWPGDFIEDQAAENIISRTMAVGGSALHWGGVTNRFSEEDLSLQSRYGLAVDWPLSWQELEPFICEAEARIGVAAEPTVFPEDQPSRPYPMPAMPLTHNLKQLQQWAEKSGIPFGPTPQAKNTTEYDGRAVCQRCDTCRICPTGARYSPDFTFKQLLAERKLTLHDRTIVRRLKLHDSQNSIAVAQAVHRDRPDEPLEYRARQFVLASGYCWSSHLLLLSACSRFPNGLANSSELVGRYMTGHPHVLGFIEMNAKTYPGMNRSYSLVSRQFFRCPSDQPYARHDLRIWESASGHSPRLQNETGKLLLGDKLLQDWRHRTSRSSARIRAYYDAHPSRDSALTLNKNKRNRWGDPLPTIDHRIDADARSREDATKSHILEIFKKLARADDGKILSTEFHSYFDHPAGGCRMGEDPATSVCDSFGNTYDHPNLFVVGSPTLPTGGCTNGTLTFAALTLRSAKQLAKTFGKSKRPVNSDSI